MKWSKFIKLKMTVDSQLPFANCLLPTAFCQLPTAFFFFLFFSAITALKAQQIPVGQWRDHLPYHNGRMVAETTDKIFCATPYGVFSYHKTDLGIERISKSSGLSDVLVSAVSFHPSSGNLIIGYGNGNLDLYKNGDIVNINSIKNSLITAGKNINRIVLHNGLAYLACGYGISLLDIEKREIRETWFIGSNGAYLNVNDIAFDNTRIFAAADNGVYYALLSSPNLSNFNSWTKGSQLPAGAYSQVENFNGIIYVNFNGSSAQTDSIFRYNSTSWMGMDQVNYSNIRAMEASAGKMAITTNWAVYIVDASWNIIETINSYQTSLNPEPRHAFCGENNITWIADNELGLIRHSGAQKNEIILPNSAASIYSYNMDCKDGKLWVANGKRVKNNGNNWFLYDGMMSFENENWAAINRKTIAGGDTIYDVITAAIDPADSRHVFLGSIGQGVWEIFNGAIVKQYNEKNSSLRQYSDPSWYHLGVSGLDFDGQGNLWVANTRVPNALSVKTPAGEWKSFSIPALENQLYIGNILVSQSGHKWMELPGAGIVVFDDNGTLANTADDKSILLQKGDGKGGLPNLAVRCIAEDRDGKIWVGTEEGIAVFSSPGAVFNGSGFDAQRILVTQNGYTGYLFETETVSAIAVDGANRKWVGTEGAGVFLISADGLKQLQHFTEEGSPLLSNFVTCITINNLSGEIFFGTENGICSYKGDAIDGVEEFDSIYVYPNPVRSGYEGPIAIKSLVTDANVKITDVSGALVFETTALGGQAIWYAKDMNGQRVQSGIYLAFCSDKEGIKTAVAKILVMN